MDELWTPPLFVNGVLVRKRHKVTVVADASLRLPLSSRYKLVWTEEKENLARIDGEGG